MTEPNQRLLSLVDSWRGWDRNTTTATEVNNLVNTEDWGRLGQIMLNRLQFGTAGIRGRMGAGFGQMNDLVIIQTSQGLLSYLQSTQPELSRRGVVVGFDGRHNSRRWAGLTAGVFVRANVPVLLFPTTVPTPYVPFTVSQRGAAAGVMVTASHNPKWDNGYKVYWDNGAQILSPHDKNIQAAILDNLQPHQEAFNVPDTEHHPLISNPLAEISSLYNSRLPLNNPREENRKLETRMVYTAMHGVGCPYVQQAWDTAGFPRDKLLIVEEQRDPDPEFSTVEFPNPEEGASALDLSMSLAAREGATYILANDPDADRLGVAQRTRTGSWRILTGNEIGALLGWWLLRCFREKSPDFPLSRVLFLASTVSSKILATIAKKEGTNFIETLTGFKHMGNKSHALINREEVVLFAYEEAIGFMCGTEVLDKDGVSAAVVLGELVRHLETRGLLLTDQLEEIYREYGYHYSINSYYICHDPATIEKIFSRLRNFSSSSPYPSTVCGGRWQVTGVRDLTTGYDSTTPDNRATLPVSSSSQMVTFWLENGVVMTFRTSGTEPKLKYYTEYCAPPSATDWGQLEDELRDIVSQVLEEFIQPGVHGIKHK